MLPLQLFFVGCIHIPQTTSEHEIARTIGKGKHSVRVSNEHDNIAKYSYGLKDNAEVGVKLINFDDIAYYPYLLGLTGKHAFLNQEKGFSLAVAGELGVFINFIKTEGEELTENLGQYPLSLTGHLLASYKEKRFEPFASISFRFLQCSNTLAKYNSHGNISYNSCYYKDKDEGGDISKSHVWPKTIYANLGLKTWILPKQLAVSFEFTRILQEDLVSSTSEKKKESDDNKVQSSIELSFVF